MYMLEGTCAQLCHPFGGEGWLRVPGIFAGALATGLLFLALRTAAGFLPAVLMAAIASALPLLIDFYTGARGYGWLVLVTLVQWCAAIRLVRGVAPARPMLVALAGASILGMLMNPLHTPWTVCMVIGLMAVCAAKRVRPPELTWKRLAVAGAFLLVIHAVWLGLWVYVMQHAGTGSAATVHGFAGLRIVAHRMLQQKEILGLICANFVLAAPLVFSGDAVRRFQGTVGVAVSLAAVLLLAALCARFFAAWRYFYIMPVCAMLSGGFHVEWLAGRAGGRALRIVKTCVSLAVALALWYEVPRAVKRANKPVQDWGAAVDYIRDHAEPNDLVLAGPNSEWEVYRVYAKAAGMTQQAPLIAESPENIQFKTDTEDGLRLIINSKRPTWFVTAAFGQHRTPEYWQLIRENFDPMEKVRGRNDILICRTKPGQ
jgi:hypothetical protein